MVLGLNFKTFISFQSVGKHPSDLVEASNNPKTVPSETASRMFPYITKSLLKIRKMRLNASNKIYRVSTIWQITMHFTGNSSSILALISLKFPNLNTIVNFDSSENH
jgi:hypothetical protein